MRSGRVRASGGALACVALCALLGCSGKAEKQRGGDPERSAAACRSGELQLEDGTPREGFRVRLEEHQESYQRWRLTAGPRVVAARIRDTLVVVDAESGAVRYRKQLGPGSDEALAGELVLATTQTEKEPAAPPKRAVYEGRLVALDAATGEPRWALTTPASVDRLLVSGDTVFFSGSPMGPGEASGHAVTVGTGAERWRVALPEEGELVAVDPGHVFAVGKDVLRALDPSSGATLWEQKISGLRARDGIALSGSSLFVGDTWRVEARSVTDGSVRWTGTSKSGSTDARGVFAHGGRAGVLGSKVYVHTDPPRPSPGDVGGMLALFDEDGSALALHQLRIAPGNAGRRSASASVAEGDRVALAVEDHLQVLSLCRLSLRDLKLSARVTGELALQGDAAYVVLEGDDLVRVDL